MAVDIEFLLAGHPLLFFVWESCVKIFHSDGVFAAIGGSTCDIHPVFARQRTGNQLCYQQGCGKITGNNEAHVLLFAANEPTADVVTRIAEIYVHIDRTFLREEILHYHPRNCKK